MSSSDCSLDFPYFLSQSSLLDLLSCSYPSLPLRMDTLLRSRRRSLSFLTFRISMLSFPAFVPAFRVVSLDSLTQSTLLQNISLTLMVVYGVDVRPSDE